MWFEWLVRRYDMGALAAASPFQQSFLDQQGSERSNPLSATDAASLLSRRKAERRAPAPHIFPPSPLPGPAVLPDDSVSSASSVVWSPLFENSSCKDLGYHAGTGGLKALSLSLLGDASSEAGSWNSDQQEPLNQLAKTNLQTVQELKQSRFSHGHETPLEPEQLSPRYIELKAGFWKRLAAENKAVSQRDENFDSSTGARAPSARVEGSGSGIKVDPIAECRKSAPSNLQGRGERGVGGACDSRLSGSVEFEVVLTGKRKGSTSDESTSSKPGFVIQERQAPGHLQNGICSPCEKNKHYQERTTSAGTENHVSSATVLEGGNDDDICQNGASSRVAIEKRSVDEESVACHKRVREQQQLQMKQQDQQQPQQDGSVCSSGSAGGIGRGRHAEDGSSVSVSTHHQACEDSNTTSANLGCRKEEDGTFWNSANWCVMDSYITGHGKETTWTVRGFEEDDGIFEENSTDFKDLSPLRLLENEIKHSKYSDLFITDLPVEGPNVETRHGPPPKWTQQALQERVAKNLREQHKEVRSAKNGLEIVKHAHKRTQGTGRSETEDGGREESEEAVLDDLMSMGNMLHCRMGRKLLKEAVLTETRDKVGQGESEKSPDMGGIHSAGPFGRWKNVRRSSNAGVGPSIVRNDRDKDQSSRFGVLRECRRRKRGWVKKRGKSSAKAVACCVSMIGGTVEALRRTREDAAALAFKLAELHAREAEELRVTVSEMRTHVDALRCEVQGLHTAWNSNVVVKYPWQQFLRSIVVAISLVSGTLGVSRAISTFRRLLFGSVQSQNCKKEKAIVAVIILCSGSYIGTETWQNFSRVTLEAQFGEKLHLIRERTSLMSTLTHKALTVKHAEEEETGQIVIV